MGRAEARREWTDEQDRELVRAVVADPRLEAIAERCRRTQRSVRARLSVLRRAGVRLPQFPRGRRRGRVDVAGLSYLARPA